MFNNSTDSTQTIERKAIEMNQLLNKLKQKLEDVKSNKTSETNYMNIIDELKIKIIEIERENKELKNKKNEKIEMEERRIFYDLNDLRNENLMLKEEILQYKNNSSGIDKCGANNIYENSIDLHKKYLQLLKDKENEKNELQVMLKNMEDEKLIISKEKMFLHENHQKIINELQKSIERQQKEIEELERNMKVKQKEEIQRYENRVDELINENELYKMKTIEIEEQNKELISNERIYKNKIQEIEEENKKLNTEKRELQDKYKILNNEIIDLKGKIRVFCRIKPILGDFKCKYNFTMTEDALNIENSAFTFHKIFDFYQNQTNIYSEVSFLIQSLFDGYNATIFAYGQTGSGKTYTMEGSDSEQGIIQQSITQIYTIIEEMKKEGVVIDISIDFVEIYNESIIDLLCDSESNVIMHLNNEETLTKCDNTIKKERMIDSRINNTYVKKSISQKRTIEILHDNKKTILKNSASKKVFTKEEALCVFYTGVKNRTVGSTNCNQRSSRSHSIFRINLQISNANETKSSVLCFIDLAGSERLYVSCSEGIRLKETQNINKSLSALGNVINAIARKESHIPFRDSKLTYFLQNSLSGSSRILMFVNISPELNHLNETLCSLRFAQKVSECALGAAQKNVQKRL